MCLLLYMAQTTEDDQTILAFIRPNRTVYRESSLQAASEALRESGADAVAVLDGPFLLGVLWRSQVSAALVGGQQPLDPVEQWVDPSPPRLLPNAPLEEARELLRTTGAPALVVVDEEGRFVGLALALGLFGRPREPAPPVVAGMATPLGVYLTTGDVSGGAGRFGLAITGAMLFSLFVTGILASLGVLQLIGGGLGLAANGPQAVTEAWQEYLLTYGPVVVFLLLVRALPISGIHASEHMVVHAIERRESLGYEVVRRMPRAHPRCGTNLAVGAMVFLVLVRAMWAPLEELGALFALVATLVLWRRVGRWVQLHFTTKPPSRRQIENAIRAGEELLAKHRRSRRTGASFGRRLVQGGLPWVMVGALTAAAAVFGLAQVFNVEIPF
ncbi:MAG: DUF1385 domain-containing protein [Armatimonadetes bacterium]|nr:DUF1385 domain-containing protein [Armatimonadota bacterium]